MTVRVYFNTKNGRSNTDVYIEHHIGDGSIDIGGAQYVIRRIRADGDELSLIRRLITGIKDAPHSSSVIWSGEDAAFIVNNIVF